MKVPTFEELFPNGIEEAIKNDPELQKSYEEGKAEADRIIARYIDNMFLVTENADFERWEFQSKTNKHTSYRISFYEARIKVDAYHAIWKAINLNL